MSIRVHRILSELRRRFEELYGDRLVKVILYGSQARGDAEADSDIDVLVVLKGRVAPWEEIARTGKDVADISLEHGVVIACVFMSEERYSTRNTPLLLNVRREGVAV